MKIAALDVFVCPACQARLRLGAGSRMGVEVLDGSLICDGCSAVYPITNGIPRFVPEGSYAQSFGHQWNWFRTVQIDSLNHSLASEAALQATTGWRDEEYEGRRLLDAGVGAGRYAERAAGKGAEVFGVDLTMAIDVAYRNIGHLPNVHLAQADIFALPFRSGTFDLAYSIGVLHHTPDPPAAFARVAQTVADGGKLAVYVYARYGPSHHMSDVFRVITTRLPLRLTWILSAAAVPLYYPYRIPLIGKVFQLMAPISMERDWRWRWLDTFDWYTPRYQSKYLYPEVFRWFRENHFDVVDMLDGPIRICGVKNAAQEPTSERIGSYRSLVAS